MIDIITSIKKIRFVSDKKRSEGERIGLVPTMGALHEGHLSLVRKAQEKADFVVVSIFVNPAQFGKNEDFNKYPRDIMADARKIETAGADCIFAPEIPDIYPEGYATYISVERLTDGLCGQSRPTHFRGVTTVVAKLFNIVNPHIAVFGQKDAQQLAVIRKMVKDLNMQVEIEAGEIVREPDGLAMSSRNSYLSAEERTQALSLSRSLRRAEQLVSDGIIDSHEILRNVRKIIAEQKLARIDYIEIVDPVEMTPVKDIRGGGLLALAVGFGTTRLIDNIVLTEKEGQNNAG